jgi:hypothetical protein
MGRAARFPGGCSKSGIRYHYPKAKLAASVPSAAGRIWAGAKLKMAAVAFAAAGLYTAAILTWQRPTVSNETAARSETTVVVAAPASPNPGKTGDALKLKGRRQPAPQARPPAKQTGRLEDLGRAHPALDNAPKPDLGAPRQRISAAAEPRRQSLDSRRPSPGLPDSLPVGKVNDAGRGTETLYGFPLHPSPSEASKASRAGASD